MNRIATLVLAVFVGISAIINLACSTAVTAREANTPNGWSRTEVTKGPLSTSDTTYVDTMPAYNDCLVRNRNRGDAYADQYCRSMTGGAMPGGVPGGVGMQGMYGNGIVVQGNFPGSTLSAPIILPSSQPTGSINMGNGGGGVVVVQQSTPVPAQPAASDGSRQDVKDLASEVCDLKKKVNGTKKCR